MAATMHPRQFILLLILGCATALVIGLAVALRQRKLKLALAWGSLGLLFSAGFVLVWASLVDPGLQQLFVDSDEATDAASLAAPLAWLALCAAACAYAVARFRGKAQSLSFFAASLISWPAWLAIAVLMIALASIPAVRY